MRGPFHLLRRSSCSGSCLTRNKASVRTIDAIWRRPRDDEHPMPTPALINEAMVAFLRVHEPFSRMSQADLEFISEHVRLAYFPVGSLIIDPASGVRVRDLHIIQRGHVRNYNAAVQ